MWPVVFTNFTVLSHLQVAICICRSLAAHCRLQFGALCLCFCCRCCHRRCYCCCCGEFTPCDCFAGLLSVQRHILCLSMSPCVCVCVRCCSFKKFCCILLSVSPLSPSSLSSCFSAQRLVARSPNSSSSGQQRCSVSKSRFTVLYAPVMSATNKQRQHFRNGESNNQAERLVNNLKVNQLKQYVNWI